MEKKQNKKLEKLIYAIAIVVILAISIASYKVNFMETISGAVSGIWNKSQEVVGETASVETASKGSHVKITGLQVAYVREVGEILGEDIDKEQAVAILQEIKTLAYKGREIGVSASKKEVDNFVNEWKEKLKEADASGYERVVRHYGEEEDYWTIVKSEIEEYIISQKVLEDKKEKLENKVDADVERELQEYIDEQVSYENFRNNEDYLK